MDSLLAFPCGTPVTTKLGKLEGMITCINIRFDSISYEVVILINSEPKTYTYHETEFDTTAVKEPIGYKICQ